MKWILTFLIVSTMQMAQAKFVEGQGRFWSEDGDKLSFINKQLISAAARDIITKEMKALGLNSEFFWGKYDERFENHLAPMIEKIRTRYIDKETGEIIADKAKEYEDRLRRLRLKQKLKFDNPASYLKKFKIVRSTRSVQMPNSRFIVISGQVSRKEMGNLYKKYTEVRESREFKTLYVSADYSLLKANWQDLGVNTREDMVKTINESWSKWLTENFKTVEKIVFVDEAMRTQLEAYQFSNSEDIDDYENDVWLKIKVRITQKSLDSLLKKQKVKIEGNMVLVDLRHRKPVSFDDWKVINQSMHSQKHHEKSSLIASEVYSAAVSGMRRFQRELKKLAQNSLTSVVVVYSKENIYTINRFIEEFNINAVKQGYIAKLMDMGSAGVRVRITHRDDPQLLNEYIQSLNGKSVATNFMMTTKAEEPFAIYLNPKVAESSEVIPLESDTSQEESRLE